MYFNLLPKIIYDFPNNTNENNNFQQIIDITSNIRFRQKFINSLKVYDIYVIKNNETIEHIAEKVYGNANYHWILMLFNERYDYINDFPLDTVTFDKYVQTKYKSRAYAINHFINEYNDIVTPNGFITLSATSINGINDNTDVLNGSTNNIILKCKTDVGTAIAKVNPFDNPLSGDNITFSFFYHKLSFIENDIIQIYIQNLDQTETFVTNAIITKIEMPEYVKGVTNYEVEYNINEKKRYIKLIPRTYLEQALQEFNALF